MRKILIKLKRGDCERIGRTVMHVNVRPPILSLPLNNYTLKIHAALVGTPTQLFSEGLSVQLASPTLHRGYIELRIPRRT